MLRAIIFDFDGVLCESVDVKTKGFRAVFSDHPQYLDDIVEYHEINGGISRYEKFRYIYKNFLKKELTQQALNELASRFEKEILAKVIEAPLVEGAVEFLEKYQKRLLFFVVTATPEEEIKIILKEKGLSNYFSEVYGSPRKKVDLIRLILKQNQWKSENVLFVGDSINDFDASQEAGVRFIARTTEINTLIFDKVASYNKIKTIHNLDTLILKEKLV